MSFEAELTRCPRPFNPERGVETAALVHGVAPAISALIVGAAGSSPYLANLVAKEADWIASAFDNPNSAVETELAACLSCGYDVVGSRLRQAKRRIALLTGLADLGGVWSLEEVTGTLSRFADTATTAAIRASIAQQIKRGKLPGQGINDIETAGGMVALAMGKMGANELNYSSDIDLICLFDETRFDANDFADARMGFVRATRVMTALLSDLTGEGYVFRTDLRLRPDPSATPVCIAMEAAERYYESLGRTWERAAFIKARSAAGDIEAGDRFLKTLGPFVWRRHLDFAAIQDAHDMRLAIRQHKGLGGQITLAGHNMKLGRGGIREIEFFTQTRQLIAGGRDPELRMKGTREGLAGLAQKEWIAPELAKTLSNHYVAHRTVEHRLQMVRDAQTHNLPTSEAEFDRLAALMDMNRSDLEADIHRRLSEVHDATEGFFAPNAVAAVQEQILDPEIMERWRTYPALRSERGAAVFERIKPAIVTRLAQAAKPQEALLALDGFLQGLPAGVQLFSLFDSNPQLIELLVDIVSTSPALAQYLSRNASVFDAVIGGDFFSEWVGQALLQSALMDLLIRESDYEAKLDATRRWTKELHFRVGVHLLRGLIDAKEAGVQYNDLARAVVGAIWPAVVDEFARRYGPPPGRGAVVLGMGSLGAGMLNAGSDLDLIVIYDPAGVDVSTGPRELATRVYYARLTQAMITALTVPMAQGRLYEVDMRLRPSGNQGPVATSWTSFQDYQQNNAWVWEHLALTRADYLAGSTDLGSDIEKFRQDTLDVERKSQDVLTEVKAMRARIAQAKPAESIWDPKIGAGRMQDIELFAQAGALLDGSPARETSSGLDACVAHGLIDYADRQVLRASYEMCWALQLSSRLLSNGVLNPAKIGEGAMGFVCRTMGYEDLVALEFALVTNFDAAKDVIDRVIGSNESNADK
ncbi:glutamine-synthetase adenylyltransferase [Ascidiaceihabitans sp.]|nr:glutamine-synthetase adenylyltransferase [Ascidiaceihabitans sp.]